MTNVTRLLPFDEALHVDADIAASRLDEFSRMTTRSIAAKRATTHTIA